MIKMINSCTLLLILSLLMPSALFAEQPKLNLNHPNKYYVKDGDTLWGISGLFLENPWAWPEIWHINEQIPNPHLIYAGDEISLVYLETDANGYQKVSHSRPQNSDKKVPALMVTKRGTQAKPTIKLSPEKRSYQLSSTIPTIPLNKVDSFLNSTRVVDRLTLKEAPYVIAGNERHLVMGKGDVIYGMGDWSEPQTAYGIYRPGKSYIDPVTEEILGYEARDIGKVGFERADGEVGVFSILRADLEIREYDKILPTNTGILEANYYPKSPNTDIQGEIIRVFSGVKNIGQYDVVVINRGAREGVEQGDVFAIYRRGMIVRDKQAHLQKVQLPDEKAGLLMVFKTHEKASLALVLQAKTVMSIRDKIRRP